MDKLLKFKEGDRVETTNSERGKITNVYQSARLWPYGVRFADGREELFEESELTLIEDRHVPSEDVTEALIKVNKQIRKLKKRQRELEIIRDVLEKFV